MKRKRDFSMLYGALAGFVLLVGGLILAFSILNASLPWYECSDFEHLFSFPEGTPYRMKDDHGGFRGEGETILVALIPPESAQDFVQVLREKGFTDTPLPEDIRQHISYHHEISAATEVSNGLWWFQDESLTWGDFIDYAFHMYDLDTRIYYYIEQNY